MTLTRRLHALYEYQRSRLACRQPPGRAKFMIYLVCVFMAIPLIVSSWRKSCDPVVDFGRELYVPWRISEGAVLYRDLEHHYGPLSQHYHALLFHVCGPGLGRLLWSNIIVYFAILGLLVHLLLTGWGQASALAGGLAFVGVFSFSQFTPISNYNYLTPYLHEVTHGLLSSLGLVAVLTSAFCNYRPWKILVAGLLFGSSVLLKPEPMLAGGLCVAAAGALACARLKSLILRETFFVALSFLAGSMVPVVIAMVAFGATRGVGWWDAVEYANMAWFGVIKFASIITSVDEVRFLGIDAVTVNAASIALWSAGAIAVIGIVTVVLRWAAAKSLVILGASVGILTSALVLGHSSIRWIDAGKLLPLVLLVTLSIDCIRLRHTRVIDEAVFVRFLLWAVAAGFFARMGLNPRIYHYGFVQAPIAATIGICFLIREVPLLARLTGSGHRAYCFIVAVAGLTACSNLIAFSQALLALKTEPVAQSDDLMYVFHRDVDPAGVMLKDAGRFVAKYRDNRPLLVLPEGVMLNYLLRIPSPIRQFQFLPAALAKGQGAMYVEALERNAPPLVVVLSRDLREHGVARFGDSPDHGSDLVSWLTTHYTVLAHDGGHPFDPRTRGWAVLQRRP